MNKFPRFCLFFSSVFILASCGLGGSDTDPEPTVENGAPTLSTNIADHTYYINEFFEYDPRLADEVFSDPDGDSLSYSVQLSPSTAEISIVDDVIVGEVSEAETFTVTVTASDPDGLSVSDTFELTFEINYPPVLAVSNDDHSYYLGDAFEYDPTLSGTVFTEANGDTLTYAVELSPDAGEVTYLEGKLFGTVTLAQTISVTITASDETGENVADNFDLIFVANDSPILVNANDDQFYYVGEAFDYDPTLNGTAFTEGNGDTLSYAANISPATNDFTFVDGSLQGQATEDGEFTITITATDETGLTASDSFQMAFVTNVTPVLDKASDDQAYYVGFAFTYDATLGGTAFSEANGDTLTYEVALSPASSEITVVNGVLSGTVTLNQLYTATIIASDETGLTASDSFQMMFVTNLSPVLDNANEDQEYNVANAFSYDATLGGTAFSEANGDTLTYDVVLSPASSEITIANGILSGTVTADQVYTATITASDDTGLTASDSFEMAFVTNVSPVLDNANDDQDYYVGSAFSYDATLGGTAFSEANGDTLTYEVVLSPTSSEITVANGILSGTVTADQVYTATITASDDTGLTASDSFEMTFVTNVSPVLDNANDDQDYYVGSAFSYDATLGGTAFSEANGDTLAYEVVLSPTSSEITVANGILSGTVTADQVYTATITASDDTGLTASDSFKMTFVSNVAPTLDSENHDQTAYVGVAFNYDVTKSGTAFSDVNGGTLIYSVEFDAATSEVELVSGVLQGTFTSEQSYLVTVTATDDGGMTVTDEFTINAIEAALCHSFEAPTNSNIADFENVFEGGTLSESLAAVDFVYSDDLSKWEMVVFTMDGIFTAVDLENEGGDNERNFGDISDEVGVINIADIFTDSQQAGVTSAVFAPKSIGNYLFVALNGKADSDATVISRVLRYEYDFDTGIDETSVIEILSVTQSTIFHHLGKLLFDDNDYLFIGLGSGENAKGNSYPQVGAELRGKILRIDVSTQPYSIPNDNPFVAGSGFDNPFSDAGSAQPREEIYAFGFRNPWEFSFDSLNNQLWVGDVGQSRWEEINKVEKGGNYGWPYYEANEDYACDGDALCVVDELVFPEYIYNHSSVVFEESEEEPEVEGVAIIGGVVYRGSNIPALYGTYLFSDYSAGTLYGMSTGADSNYQIDIIASTASSFYSYIEGPDGEVYIVQGSEKNVLKLIAKSDAAEPGNQIPDTLSATGCVNIHSPFEPMGDLVEYEVTTPLWSDGAEKHRYISVPDGVSISGTTDFNYPVGTTLVKNFSFAGVPHETRLMVLHDTGWGAYTYQWDWENKEAHLLYDSVDAELDNGLAWTYPSRSNCFACHTEVAGRVLGFEALQLNKDRSSDAEPQIEWLGEAGVLSDYLSIDLNKSLVSIADQNATYTDKMKSYVHANCAFCHQPEGTAQAAIDFRYDTPLADMGICNADALYTLNSQPDLTKIVDSNDYLNSILYWRVLATGNEKMPPVGRELVDEDFLQLLVDWHNIEGTECPTE